MIDHLDDAKDKPQFCYHVGDVVYFTGDRDDYYAQFYEPYAHYDVPILAIPGNHDGEVDDPTAQTSLDGWVDYFMQAHPDVDPISKDAPRVQLNLPNVYWTLITQLATIIGMYTNVPEHGSIDSTQQQWVTNEFATAPKDRALILALHHPIYSFDTFHSGSSKMADVLENAIRDTGRVPNLVLSGHVHDYQRIEQTIAPDGRRRSSLPAMAATTISMRSFRPGDKPPTPARCCNTRLEGLGVHHADDRQEDHLRRHHRGRPDRTCSRATPSATQPSRSYWRTRNRCRRCSRVGRGAAVDGAVWLRIAGSRRPPAMPAASVLQ